ncbi:MAG: 4,5-DOPA dioxygenase extradiol [Sulfurospirillaceae bacterium]|nr:4,5-DOPA dioxygenase extradiol [Sulfurospirillaceae bacterium]MDD2826704.1 4,5-DOPA dioxygenase extradiol [Sulfurospirillaceae bacterium]
MNRRKFTYLASISTLLATLPAWANSEESLKPASALFIGHGTPMNGFRDNEFTKEWDLLGKTLRKPRAILVVSAHWETSSPMVSTSAKPPIIYDFYGFPDFMYDVTYNADGAPKIAHNITNSFTKKIVEDPTQGLDHGAWIVLLRLFPQADVPVFQFSLARSMTPIEHFQLGQEMQALRDEGVMIIGSGNITHNIPSARNDAKLGTRNTVHDWAKSFDERVTSIIDSGDFKALSAYEKFGKEATMSVPTPEHFLPLLYVLGSAKTGEKARYYAKGFQAGSFSMRSVLLG